MNAEMKPNHANRARSPKEHTERMIGILLRTGVISAAFVVLLGGFFFLLHAGPAPDYRVFRGEPSELEHVFGIVREAASFRSRGVIQLGLLLLIATPVARVAFSVWAFARERDWVYVCVTLVVLGLLLASLVGL
jgi:uncharacterized membrane protein